MSGVIHVLSDAVANQIAAGEVIQRPASVVKELMENAVDAGASVIKVLVKDAGKTLIQVVDNGAGMSREDARLCFQRHATSKISKADDLFAIRTRGFRGEALASVAAVAEVTLKTRLHESDVGTMMLVKGSLTERQESVQAPPGTNIQVRNLFFNLPARRKFLKSDQTELRHIINEFNHVSLTNHGLECVLQHNQSEILHLYPGNLRQRIAGIFGKSILPNLIPLETETTIVKISGFIGKPEHARRKYGEQFFFVNDRYIRHPYFHKAVMSGYEQILPDDHIPSYFIYFKIDPGKIDVNIHPSKTEVKFEDEKAIWQMLLASVRKAIGKHNLSPSLDFDREGVIDIPVISKDTEIKAPEIDTDPTYNPFKGDPSYRSGRSGHHYRDDRLEEWQRLFDPTAETDKPVNKYLQIKNKYILSPVKSGLMVVDQHRAHERIMYEKILDVYETHEPLAQQSLFPETIRLNAADYQVCLEMIRELNEVGFDIRDFGNNSVVVHGIPSDMSQVMTGDRLEMMIEQYKSLHKNKDLDAAHRIAMAASRTAAVNYGRKLNGLEMQELVDRLFACNNPNYSPSGKPIVKIMEVGELEALFKN